MMVAFERQIPIKGPLMIGIGGLGVEIASGLSGVPSGSILMLDTDRRSMKWRGEREFRLVGGGIASGEGSGGNLNIARACFRKEMEDLASVFLPRSPVVLLSSTGGATGLAGAAEIGGLLIRTDRPSLSVLVRGELEQGMMDTKHITSMMLDGPLRPGCAISLDMETCDEGPVHEVRSRSELSSFLSSLLLVFSGEAPLPMDVSALQSMRKEGGVRRVLRFAAPTFEEVPPLPPRNLGSEMVLVGVGRKAPVERLRSLAKRLAGDRGDVHIGFYEHGPSGKAIEGFIVRPVSEVSGEHQEPLTTRVLENGLSPDDPRLATSQSVEGGFSPIHR